MRNLLLTLLVIAHLGTFSSAIAAQASLASVFGDHMVLQRDQVFPVWGDGKTGDKISVRLQTGSGSNKQTTSSKTVVDKSGIWRVNFGPLPAGGPYTMQVDIARKGGTSKVTKLADILIGDVWLCSGQSNMGFRLDQARTGKQDIAQSTNSQIRLLRVNQFPSPSRQKRLKDSPRWQLCDSSSTPNFTAVGYYFGRDLQKHLNIPVGLIQSSVGGTSAECWMSREALREFPEFGPAVSKIEKEARDPRITKERYKRLLAMWEEQQRAKQLNKETSGTASARTTTSTRATSPTLTQKPTPDGHPRRATVLFNGMIAPLVPYALKGVIWYQGESNVSRSQQYQRLFPALIAEWRKLWSAPDLPFLYVQLPYFHPRKAEPADDTWAELREAQLMTYRSVPNTGMAITVDTGDAKDIHPADKEPVGARLASAARAIAYGEKLEWSGPLFTTATPEQSAIRVAFDHIGGGLKTCDGSDKLRGFAIAGEDKKFAWADATIDTATNTVTVNSSSVSKPVAVRYAWQANPDCNLCNSEGLPASPFRTDDWPLTSAGNMQDSAPPPE